MGPIWKTLALLALAAALAACGDDDAGALDGGAGKDAAVEASTGPDIAVKPDQAAGASVPTGGKGGGVGNKALKCSDGRDYQLWVPTSYSDSKPAPLVVAMHGLGDTHTNFIAVMKYVGWTGLSDSEGFILMVPDHLNKTRKSFLHVKGTSSLDAPGTQKEAKDLLTCIYSDLGKIYNLETTEIYWLGFSEGATFSVYAAWLLHNELRAVAPYAGGMSGLPLPAKRKIPAYFITGTQDYSYSAIVKAYNAWVAGGHPGKNAWVSNVGHSFSGLHSAGPKPKDVYSWMRTVKTDPVVSGYKK